MTNNQLINILCGTPEEYGEILVQTLSLNEASRLMNHVLEHGDMAKKLNHQIEYGAQIYTGGKSPLLLFEQVYARGNVSKEDRVKIALAPKEPSEGDYQIARENGWNEEA